MILYSKTGFKRLSFLFCWYKYTSFIFDVVGCIEKRCRSRAVCADLDSGTIGENIIVTTKIQNNHHQVHLVLRPNQPYLMCIKFIYNGKIKDFDFYELFWDGWILKIIVLRKSDLILKNRIKKRKSSITT